MSIANLIRALLKVIRICFPLKSWWWTWNIIIAPWFLIANSTLIEGGFSCFFCIYQFYQYVSTYYASIDLNLFKVTFHFLRKSPSNHHWEIRFSFQAFKDTLSKSKCFIVCCISFDDILLAFFWVDAANSKLAKKVLKIYIFDFFGKLERPHLVTSPARSGWLW